MKNLIQKIMKPIIAVFTMVMLLAGQTQAAEAARINSLAELDRARVSFTFDDGFASTRTLAAPILEARGIDGVLYLSSGAPDGTFTLDDNQPAITWEQVRELQNDFGWEIGGHTEMHGELPEISQQQLRAELANSNNAFIANGLNVTNFASPFGAYDNTTLPEILKYYKSQRGFADRESLNVMPYNKSVLMVQSVEEGVTNAQVQAWVDQAIAQKRWLILVYHDIAPQHNPDYIYTNTTAELTAHANYVQSKVNAGQIDAVTIEEGITIPGANVLQNSGFEAGLANGWTTDNTAVVKADNNNNGNYGSPVQSVSLTGTATAGHLFSPQTGVVYNTSYILDVFVNTIGLTSGELGFLIDEYDANGNWISDKWLGAATNGTIGFFTALYNASSELVKSIKVQVYLTAGSTGTAYIDSLNLYNIDGTVVPTGTPTPTPIGQPTPTASPSGANIVVNGSFNNGSSAGWSTDNPEKVVVATDEVNYFAMFTGGVSAAHLFSDLIAVNPLTNYLFQVTADTTGLTSGELGFYIDEYDAAGNWVSGQWVGAALNNTSALYEVVYKATSNLVASMSIQTYLTGGSTGYALTDDYALFDPNATPSATPTPTVVPTGTPTVTPTPTVEPTPVPTTGFVAQYFNNETLSGTPVLTRNEETINNDWGAGSPGAPVTVDNFSARWTKTEAFEAGDYEFTVTGDDGIRLLIDGQVVIDKFIPQAPTTYKATKAMTAGNHTIVLEYFENGGGAVAKLAYKKAPGTPAPSNEYVAEYFNNKELTGTPVVTRNEAAIDFDWGAGSPAPAVNADTFGARWTRTVTVTEGTYTFTATGDDGIRVLVDGEVVVNGYKDQAPTTYTANKALTAGNHTIVVEYFESGGGAVAQFNYALATTNEPAPTTTYAAKFWNLSAAATPAIPATAPTATRNDATINFDWAGGAPIAGVNADRFVAQWIKNETFEAGNYKFTTVSDDRIRVYVDNELVIDQWNDHPATTHTAEKTMTAGLHEVRVEYYEAFGDAVAKFNFEKVTSGTPNTPSETFTAEFFNNLDLFGAPVLTRQDASINFNWLNGSPDAIINLDQFSARWTRTKNYEAGTYTFNLTSDDGVRFYLDNQLLINDWTGHPLTPYTVTVPVTAGLHTVKVEYFEAYGDAVITLDEVKN
jgi:peptidoglycan/xylan/chitin deacetylase (PgdA/CDA1 family)